MGLERLRLGIKVGDVYLEVMIRNRGQERATWEVGGVRGAPHRQKVEHRLCGPDVEGVTVNHRNS